MMFWMSDLDGAIVVYPKWYTRIGCPKVVYSLFRRVLGGPEHPRSMMLLPYM